MSCCPQLLFFSVLTKYVVQPCFKCLALGFWSGVYFQLTLFLLCLATPGSTVYSVCFTAWFYCCHGYELYKMLKDAEFLAISRKGNKRLSVSENFQFLLAVLALMMLWAVVLDWTWPGVIAAETGAVMLFSLPCKRKQLPEVGVTFKWCYSEPTSGHCMLRFHDLLVSVRWR